MGEGGTWERMGHRRGWGMGEGGTWEGEKLGVEEKGIRRGKTGKYLPTWTVCDQVTYEMFHV